MNPSRQIIKVLFIYTHTIHGGGETYLLRILDGVDNTKIEPIAAISSRNKRLADDLKKRNITYVVLPDMNLLWKNKIAKMFIQLPNFLLMNIIMAWMILKYQPRIVHAGLFYSGLFSVLPTKLLGRRFAWVALTESDLIAYPHLTGFLMRFSDKTISVCKYFIEIAHERGLPATERMEVIYTGLTNDRFENHAEKPMFGASGNKINHPIVALVARYDESQKGHIYFWEMASLIHKKMKDVNFVVAGAPGNHGEELFKERLEVMARKINLSQNLFFAGFIKDIPMFLSQIDILILPSTNEGAPVIVQEAGASGKPIVASSVGGVSELLRDGETGFLVPPRDAEALAEKTLLLLSDPVLARKMGERGKKFVYDHFRERKFIESYEHLYESLSKT